MYYQEVGLVPAWCICIKMSMREKHREQVEGRKKRSEHGKDEISLIRTGRYKWGTLLHAQPASRKRALPQSALSVEDEKLCCSPSVPSLWSSCVVWSEQTCHEQLVHAVVTAATESQVIVNMTLFKTKSGKKMYGLCLKFNVTGIFWGSVPKHESWRTVDLAGALNRGVHMNDTR